MLSVIIPSYNEEMMIQKTAGVISNILAAENIENELIFVDDGSTDGTWDEILDQAEIRPNVRGLHFSRNFGKESAIMAGLNKAKGDCCAVIDCDLQMPPETMVEMYRLWEQGYEIIEGRKSSRGNETAAHAFAAHMFYTIISRACGFDMENASDFKLLDRRAVDVLINMREKNGFFRAMTTWVGFQTAEVEFEVQDREAGESKWSTKGLIRYAIRNITSFSTAPMQAVTFLGIVMLVVSVIFSVIALVQKFTGAAENGFTTIIILQLFSASVIMISLGIIGYYIACIYDEIKGRPLYIISTECGDGIPVRRLLPPQKKERKEIPAKKNVGRKKANFKEPIADKAHRKKNSVKEPVADKPSQKKANVKEPFADEPGRKAGSDEGIFANMPWRKAKAGIKEPFADEPGRKAGPDEGIFADMPGRRTKSSVKESSTSEPERKAKPGEGIFANMPWRKAKPGEGIFTSIAGRKSKPGEGIFANMPWRKEKSGKDKTSGTEYDDSIEEDELSENRRFDENETAEHMAEEFEKMLSWRREEPDDDFGTVRLGSEADDDFEDVKVRENPGDNFGTVTLGSEADDDFEDVKVRENPGDNFGTVRLGSEADDDFEDVRVRATPEDNFGTVRLGSEPDDDFEDVKVREKTDDDLGTVTIGEESDEEESDDDFEIVCRRK